MLSRWMETRRPIAVASVMALGVAALLAATSSAATDSRDQAAAKTATAKIALVIPGPNAYFNKPWAAAAKDAGKKYGFSAEFAVPASQAFNLTQQNALLDSLAAKGYNGFGLFPGDARGTNAQARKMKARGIETININGCTYDPAPAVFCVSTNVYTAALYQAQQLIKAIGGKGDIALLTSQLTDPNTQLRIQAVKKAVALTKGKVKLAQVVSDIDTPQSAPPAINALLASKGDTLDGAMSTSFNPAVAMATALTDNPQYRRIKFIGAENSPQVMNAVRKGYIYGTLFQNTYGQAYIGAYVLYKVIQKGCTIRSDAPFQTTPQTKKLLSAGVLIVNNSNIKQFSGPLESLPADTTRLLKVVDTKVLSC